jgi:hypothetical protein
MSMPQVISSAAPVTNQPGFTLFELLIYVGILSTVVTGVILMVGEMFKIQAKVRSAFVLQDNLGLVEHRIKYSVQNAADLALPATGTGSVLRVNQTTSTGDTADFALSGGHVIVSIRGEAAVELTSPEIEITALTFERLQGTSPAIKYRISGRLRSAEPYLQLSEETTGYAKISR